MFASVIPNLHRGHFKAHSSETIRFIFCAIGIFFTKFEHEVFQSIICSTVSLRDRKGLIFTKLEEKFSNVTVASNTNQVCSRQRDGLPGCVWEGYKQEGVGVASGIDMDREGYCG